MLAQKYIDVLWEQVKDDLFLDKDEFVEQYLSHWTPEFCPDDKTPAFVFLVKGPEFHFYSLGTKQPMPIKWGRSFLIRLVKREGFACTRTLKDDKRQQRFNERIGFYKTHEDEYDIFYRIDEVKEPCQP